MRSLRRAAARFRDAGSVPILAGLLLIAAAAPMSAGERSRPSSSSDMGGRSAQPRGGGGGNSGGGHSSPPPSYSPPPSSGGGGGGGSERHAVPRGSGGGGSDRGEPSRQRPHNPSGGGGGYHGGGYGHGYYGGYYGYPYYYYGPYWGWGWGWGAGWWWDDYYWYGRAAYYGYPYGSAGYYDRYGAAGALDIDVSPGKTEVWIDGRYTGTADDFDGFPQYLWLDAGTYDVVLFREGYTTIARQVSIRPGQVIGMGDRLQPGESVRPENLATKTHERRDERIRSEEERRDQIAREDGLEDWRERARQRMNERYEDTEDGEREVEAPDDDVIGRLHVTTDPGDASVYVDGRFVGTGIDLQRVRNGLRLEPGEHRIAVVRPGRKAVEQSFTVAVGEEVELSFDLESLE